MGPRGSWEGGGPGPGRAQCPAGVAGATQVPDRAASGPAGARPTLTCGPGGQGLAWPSRRDPLATVGKKGVGGASEEVPAATRRHGVRSPNRLHGLITGNPCIPPGTLPRTTAPLALPMRLSQVSRLQTFPDSNTHISPIFTISTITVCLQMSAKTHRGLVVTFCFRI